jgi:hypothetical protein
LRKSFRVSFDEKLLLWFWSVDAAPGSSLVDLHDALSAHSKFLGELLDQAVAVIARASGLLLDTIVGQAPDDEPGLLSREYLFFWKATQSFSIASLIGIGAA